MQCFECGYQCSPYDHTKKGTDGGPTWTCERCYWSCKVNDTPKDRARWEQAMKMQGCVDEQLGHDEITDEEIERDYPWSCARLVNSDDLDRG